MPDHAKQVGILCQRVIDLLGLSMTEGQSILLGESNVATWSAATRRILPFMGSISR